MANSASLSVLNRPAEVGTLLLEPVARESVALRVSTIWSTDSESVKIPRILTTPSADWIAPNDEIKASEATGSSITVTPKKLAAISYIANELADDTSPEAAGIIADTMAIDMAKKIDRAFFGPFITDDQNPDYNAERPAGLESIPLANLARIDANPVGTSLDAFIDAAAAAEDRGVSIDHWVTTTYVKTALRKIKASAGANSYLIDNTGGELTVLGAPVLTSPYVSGSTAATSSVWGIPKARTYTVLRKDIEVDFDASIRFNFYQVAVRGVMRLAFGLPYVAGTVLIRD